MSFIKQTLPATETEGDGVKLLGGVFWASIDYEAASYPGGTWQVQFLSPLNNWVPLDVEFTERGAKSFDAVPGLEHRIAGGTAGCVGWFIAAESQGVVD